MSSLIEELQRNIVNDATPVTTVLRQMKLAASKLQLPTIERWVSNELDGYGTTKPPKYRVISGVPRAFNPYNGWIPILVDNSKVLQAISECFLYHPLSVLEGWVVDRKGSLQLSMPSTKQTFLRSNMRVDFEVALFVDPNSIKGVISTVRNKALDWVIDLEKHKVVGHSFSFSDVEKERAQMTINNFGHMTGAIGSNNTVGNISVDASSQIKNILSQAKKYSEALVHEGVERDGMTKSLKDLEEAVGSNEEGIIKTALESVKSTLSEAAGGAIATGLLQMIQQLPL